MKRFSFSIFLLIVAVFAMSQKVLAQAISNPALYAPFNGGARILATQGTAANPDFGFSGSGAVPANLNDGGGGNGIFRPAANTMAFTTGSIERMRITSGGALGVGTTAPTQRLQVSNGNVLLDYSNINATTGNIFLGGVTYPANQNGMRLSFFNSAGTAFKNGYIDVRTIGGTANDGLIFRVDNTTAAGTERMRICANGNVGIGTATPGTYRLNVNGTAFVTSGFWSGSDQRFKKNINPVQNALEKVLTLQGKTYEFDREKFQDRNFQAGKVYGFLAQELQQVLPEAVKEGIDGYLSVSYDMIVPVLAEAVKELKAENDQQISEMETRLGEKDRQISTLEARLAKLEAAFDRTAAPVMEAQKIQMSNQPNPFSGLTTVNCTIPATVHTAELIVLDMTGREIARQILSERGPTSVEVNLQNAPSGTYIGTLVADGKPAGTLKLVVSSK